MSSGRLAWYLKPADAHVVIGSVEFSGAWRQQVPFQLMLGDREGGVRGYTASRSAGARASGLLAAFPVESQRLWRIDLALPVGSAPHAGSEVRLTTAGTRHFWKEPVDLARGRAGAAPSTIFGWP